MSKKTKIVNVYTGLLVGALSGWLIRKRYAQSTAKTTIIGAGAYRFPADTDYDKGWNDGIDNNPSIAASNQASAQYLSGYYDALTGAR